MYSQKHKQIIVIGVSLSGDEARLASASSVKARIRMLKSATFAEASDLLGAAFSDIVEEIEDAC